MDASAAAAAGDDGFFTSYADVAVHELMLKDEPRVSFFERVFATGVLRGKVVLDVGAGTGILSLLAARHGAARVYAVEASDVAKVAQQIVSDNGFDGVVRVLHSRVEDVPSLPEPADVLISEWFGFHLLHEGMAHSVIYARDHLLRPGGVVVPAEAELLCSPVSLDEWRREKIDFWRSVRGFDFSAMVPHAVAAASSSPEAIVMRVPSACVVAGAPQSVAKLDMNAVTSVQLLSLAAPLQWALSRDANVAGFCLWFAARHRCEDGDATIELCTGPHCPDTHWKQTVLHLPEPVSLRAGDRVACTVALSVDVENLRHYELSAEEFHFSRSLF